MPNIVCLGLLAILVFTATPVAAHKASDSYLRINLEHGAMHGQWDIALRDLEHAVGLDRDLDGAITWGELRKGFDDVAAYALARLRITDGRDSCRLELSQQLADHHSDGAYAVLGFQVHCRNPGRVLELHYDLLFDLDAQHRGLLQFTDGERTESVVFAPERRSVRFPLGVGGTSTRRAGFLSYLKEGLWHIWKGVDHLLFVVTLLLPAVLRRRAGQWMVADGLREVFSGVLKVVTAFTVAHSITLSMAVLGVVQPPSRLVEAVIAASVIAAALNNLYPVLTRRLWLGAFGFGLVHGFGFAGVLADLGLPADALGVSLLGFNLGVEVGQLVVVAAALPVLYWLRNLWFYPRWVLGFGSSLAAGLATLWLVERIFGGAVAGI